MSHIKPVSLLAVLLIGLAMAALPLSGQSSPRPLTRTQLGLGYTGNAPDALLGASAYVLVPRIGPLDGGIGLYVDFKFDYETPEDNREFNSALTVQELLSDPTRERADYLDSESAFRSVNLAVVRPLTPYLMAYVGGGIAMLTRYERFNLDQNDEAGVGGLVVVENPERDETRGNLMVGILMRLSSLITTQFGFETQPQGLTFGGSLRLPPW